MTPLARAATTLLCSGLIAACAAEPQVGAGPLRLLVKLARPGAEPAAIARLASLGAGVPASYLAASSASWHAIALDCGGARACTAALERLRADRTNFEAVERDERKRIVTP